MKEIERVDDSIKILYVALTLQNGREHLLVVVVVAYSTDIDQGSGIQIYCYTKFNTS